MNQGLYTVENCSLAARLHGDPNPIHQVNRVAPGIMQLQGFITTNNWVPGSYLDVSLLRQLIAPNLEAYISTDLKDSEWIYQIHDNDPKKPFSRAVPFKATHPSSPSTFSHCYNYDLVESGEIQDWSRFNSVPLDLVQKTVPKTTKETLKGIAAVGVAANALVRKINLDTNFVPELYFPPIRGQGDMAILESGLVLYMGYTKDGKMPDHVELGVGEVRQDQNSKKRMIASVHETSGLFALDFYFRKIEREKLLRKLQR